MNNNSSINYWNDMEETQLINEINNLLDINEILKNHNRKMTGILIRIQKILNDPIKSNDILDKNKIIDKYLANTKNKYFVNYDELYLKILNFNSLDEISNYYNKLSLTKIKNILSDFLKKKDIDMAKKLRIVCLLKSKDDMDIAEKIFNGQDNLSTNTNSTDLNNNINSIMIMLLDEIKTMKSDIFDIKNRVKIIMDKVCVSDRNNNSKKSYDLNNKINFEIYESVEEKHNINLVQNNNLDLNDKSNNNNNIKNDKDNTEKKNNKNKDKDNDKKIKIIMVNNKKKSIKNDDSFNNLSYDNISDYDNDELDKELEKILC